MPGHESMRPCRHHRQPAPRAIVKNTSPPARQYSKHITTNTSIQQTHHHQHVNTTNTSPPARQYSKHITTSTSIQQTHHHQHVNTANTSQPTRTTEHRAPYCLSREFVQAQFSVQYAPTHHRRSCIHAGSGNRKTQFILVSKNIVLRRV